MNLDKLILGIVAVSPSHQIEGKKRVHKSLYLSQFAGEEVPADFYIKHFGVFSDAIAERLAFLSVFDFLETNETQVGPNGYFATVFRNPFPEKANASLRLTHIIERLSQESTPVLEVASTIAYFLCTGLNEKGAEQKTKDMKPAISNGANLVKSKKLLADLQSAHA